MHQTRMGNQYYFSMKANGGTDAASGPVHSVKATGANAADVAQAGELLNGEEREAFGDAGSGVRSTRIATWSGTTP